MIEGLQMLYGSHFLEDDCFGKRNILTTLKQTGFNLTNGAIKPSKEELARVVVGELESKKNKGGKVVFGAFCEDEQLEEISVATFNPRALIILAGERHFVDRPAPHSKVTFLPRKLEFKKEDLFQYVLLRRLPGFGDVFVSFETIWTPEGEKTLEMELMGRKININEWTHRRGLKENDDNQTVLRDEFIRINRLKLYSD